MKTKSKFKKLKADCTIGEKYKPAMEIDNQEDADAYFEILVAHLLKNGTEKRTRAEAETVERRNLGYFAGYYDYETMGRVNKLFNCSHPVFGAVK